MQYVLQTVFFCKMKGKNYEKDKFDVWCIKCLNFISGSC